MLQTHASVIDATLAPRHERCERTTSRLFDRRGRRILFAVVGALLITIPMAVVLLCRTVYSSHGSTDAGRDLLSCACWGLVLASLAYGTAQLSGFLRTASK